MSTSRGKITVNSRSTWSTARARCTRRREQKATSNGAGIVCTNCGAEFLMGAIKSQASEVLGTRVIEFKMEVAKLCLMLIYSS